MGVPQSVEAGLLGNTLYAEHRTRGAVRELAELIPGRALSGRRIAVVDEQPLRSRRTQQGRGVLSRVGREPILVYRTFRRLEVEERRELPDRTAIRQTGGNVQPLPRVRALREEPAKLVERRLTAQDAVRVVIDQFDRVQYFEKWPCCSNASSPSE